MEATSDLLTEEILPRLPVAALLKCKCVCKDWLHLISSSRFIKNHLYRPNPTRIIIPSPYALVCYNYEANHCTKISYPPKISGETTTILGSCDGLICLLDKGSNDLARRLVVFNPSTSKSIDVKLGYGAADFLELCCSWFGHHPSSVAGEYVLVLAMKYQQGHRGIQVYKFTRRSNIKPIHSASCLITEEQHPNVYLCPEEKGTLLHGTVHWPANWNRSCPANWNRTYPQVISAYNIEKNAYLEFYAPIRQHLFRLGVVDGCLIATSLEHPNPHNRMFQLWIMREYRVEKSWTKYCNIDKYNCWFVSPLGFCPNGVDLILNAYDDLTFFGILPDTADRSKLIKFNFIDKKATLLKVDDVDCDVFAAQAIICADSLVSPKIWGSRIALKRCPKNRR